ncbi:MauE/DoxX family redox-associated membrane protein [Sphingobacterium faecium]|uniref:MauE/DoxX family redox-associated membrane protein n=1 Tax=Sphingobacterium faecium TaxID=34087 RepID=UPI003D35BBD7
MIFLSKNKNIILGTFHYLIFTLLLYSAVSKIAGYDLFVNNLDKSPFFKGINTNLIAVGVISLEILIPVLFFFNKTTKVAYLLSFFLFFLFTGYIIMMFLFSPYLPCSCGGLIEKLSWKQHIYFNIVFIIFSAVLYLIEKKDENYS